MFQKDLKFIYLLLKNSNKNPKILQAPSFKIGGIPLYDSSVFFKGGFDFFISKINTINTRYVSKNTKHISSLKNILAIFGTQNPNKIFEAHENLSKISKQNWIYP